MKTWRDPQPVTVPPALDERIGGHPLISRHLVRRGIHTPQAAEQFLAPQHYTPTPPDALPDIDKAVSRVQRAIANRESILVWGDFDVDGQTSTALLVAALRDLGATQVRYHIPNRFREGHGVHLPTLKTLLAAGADLVLTCDTGVAAHESIAHAQAQGVDVIVTDHHSLPETLPDAYAVVNPMRLEAGHALRELPGVGTAYKLVQALYGSTSSEHLLDLVAMGIVADVMVQVDDTRYLLQRGLEKLRSEPRPGLRAMMERAGIQPADLTESDIGFSLAPRLNALGRLADANPAVELLTTDDTALITERVNELEGLNQKRKFLTRQVYESAQQQIQADESLLKYAALVVAGEDWHTGVVGIVASRLADDYARPVLVLSQQGAVTKGSARSVAGCDIIAAIRTQADLLDGFGGHTMAAGVTLSSENLFAFRRGLSQAVREMLVDVDEEPMLTVDGYLSLAEIDLALAEDIHRLAPFGNGNPPLTLATKNVRIVKRRTMGSRGDHLDLRVADENGNEQRVVWWFGETDALPDGAFDIAYTLRPNVYKGKREAMVEWLDARPRAASAVDLNRAPAYDVIDARGHLSPQSILDDYNENVLIWAEGAADVTGADRYALHPAETLVVWTTPPGVSEWRALVNEVQPQRIVLLGTHRPEFTVKELLAHLAGMAKFALNRREGRITLYDMVTATGQREATIRIALSLLQQTVPLRFEQLAEDVYQVQASDKAPADETTRKQLAHLLNETHAYQQLWHTLETVI